MELDVRSLPQGPSETVLEADAFELDLGGCEPGFEGRVRVRVGVARNGDNLLVRGRGEGRVRGECARCLEVAELPLGTEFTVYAERRPKGGVRGLDRELEADHYLCFHDGIRRELGEAVREALLLALPIRFVCRPDCRGLCPGCGANLNQEPCTCAERGARAGARATDP